MSLAKTSGPFAFYPALTSFASQPSTQTGMRTLLKLMSPACQSSTNAGTWTLHPLMSLLESPDCLHFFPSRAYHQRHPPLTSADNIGANQLHSVQPMPDFLPPPAYVTSVELWPLTFLKAADIISMDMWQLLATTVSTPADIISMDTWQLPTTTVSTPADVINMDTWQLPVTTVCTLADVTKGDTR